MNYVFSLWYLHKVLDTMKINFSLNDCTHLWIIALLCTRNFCSLTVYSVWLDEAETNSYFLAFIQILWTRNCTADSLQISSNHPPSQVYTNKALVYHHFILFLKKKRISTNFTVQWCIHYLILFLCLLKLKMHMPCYTTLL